LFVVIVMFEILLCDLQCREGFASLDLPYALAVSHAIDLSIVFSWRRWRLPQVFMYKFQCGSFSCKFKFKNNMDCKS